MGSSFESSRHRVRIIRRRKRKSTTKGTHQTELKIPTQKKRKENRQGPRHNFLASSKNPGSERKKEKKGKIKA
jgi:hypothetical protein